MKIEFTQEELQEIINILSDIPIKHIGIVERVRSMFQRKIRESVEIEVNDAVHSPESGPVSQPNGCGHTER